MQEGRVHFIGIGGAGMSAIAAILAERGLPVSGSDLKESRNTQRLAAAGAHIFIGHRSANVDGAGLVVYSSAIRDTNKEMARARELGLEIIPRAMMLARLMATVRPPPPPCSPRSSAMPGGTPPSSWGAN
jgi:UDP-N-acetylmuramate--alanine ligase